MDDTAFTLADILRDRALDVSADKTLMSEIASRPRHHRCSRQAPDMTFFDLILRNLWKKKARSLGLLLAVAVAVMTVVALDVTSSGLEQSAAAIISVGKADFTVAQKGRFRHALEHDRP